MLPVLEMDWGAGGGGGGSRGACLCHDPPRAHGGLQGRTPSRGLARWVLIPTRALGGTPVPGAHPLRAQGKG